MSVTATGLTKIYGKQKALDKVSFEVKPGEIIGLLGPNGAGKSTLMKILTCFIPATSGNATVCGYDVAEQSLEVRQKIGYLPENNPLYTDLYILEFLKFIAGTRRIKGNVNSRIADMMEITGLGPEQHKKIGALSKGYRQRVGLAQALLHDPEVLILDEPTSGLDPNQLLEIRGLIRDIGKTKTILMSTHIMQEVEAICNRVIIIHRGKMVADDSTANLRQIAEAKAIIRVEFAGPVEGKLLLAIPGVSKVNLSDIDTLHGAISGKSSSTDHQSKTWHLEADPGIDIRPAVFQFAVDHKLTVLSLHREEQKLEEVFQELTRN
jgi:ABC-2 type transport system ATP-binding protein